MKRKLLVSAVMLTIALGASAQVKSSKGTVIDNSSSVAYSLPRTTLKVTVVAQRDAVRKGPYARFAQKYLGVMAPLSDKDVYTIEDAYMTSFEEADPSEVYVMENPGKSPVKIYEFTREGAVATSLDGFDRGSSFGSLKPQCLNADIDVMSNIYSDTSFVKVNVDKKDIIERSAESMAQEAAQTIFTIRKRRMDLVTGDAGENVFGEGLKTAIAELNRLENEYIALFMGKQYRQRIVNTYDVTPEKGKNTLIVCRFSDSAGLLPAADLTGRPVLIDFAAENKSQSTALARKNTKDPRGMVFYRIADVVKCRVMDANREISSTRIPIYQFGTTVEIPVNALK